MFEKKIGLRVEFGVQGGIGRELFGADARCDEDAIVVLCQRFDRVLWVMDFGGIKSVCECVWVGELVEQADGDFRAMGAQKAVATRPFDPGAIDQNPWRTV